MIWAGTCGAPTVNISVACLFIIILQFGIIHGFFCREAGRKINFCITAAAFSGSDQYYAIACLASVQCGSRGAFQYGNTFYIFRVQRTQYIAAIASYAVGAVTLAPYVGWLRAAYIGHRHTIYYIQGLVFAG